MRIHLVRHGETAPNPPNSFYGGAEVPLSANGELQATAAADFLANEDIECIISSPLQRARFGAHQVQLRHSRVAITVMDGIREVDRGRWVGHDMQSLCAKYPDDWPCYVADPINWRGHGGESLGQLHQRVTSAFNDILKLDFDNVVIVAHMFPIRSILAQVRQMDVADDLINLQIPTASVSRILLDKASQSLEVEQIGHVPY